MSGVIDKLLQDISEGQHVQLCPSFLDDSEIFELCLKFKSNNIFYEKAKQIMFAKLADLCLKSKFNDYNIRYIYKYAGSNKKIVSDFNIVIPENISKCMACSCSCITYILKFMQVMRTYLFYNLEPELISIEDDICRIHILVDDALQRRDNSNYKMIDKKIRKFHYKIDELNEIADLHYSCIEFFKRLYLRELGNVLRALNGVYCGIGEKGAGKEVI
jgi:hypothetical protein